MMFLILQKRKLRLREVKQLVQVPKVRKCQGNLAGQNPENAGQAQVISEGCSSPKVLSSSLGGALTVIYRGI